MSDALLSGVSGLKANQKMLDVAGNNLANINTTAFKGSRITFAELLSETLTEASQPTANIGGTNPMQIGSGVQIASVDRDVSQGSLVNTGQPLDMAIEGAGYFVLNDGQRDVYTRVGAFAVDADFSLVDPGTGYRVQRVGSEGIAEGFQDASNNDIRVPFDIALPAKATSEISYTGNLSADADAPTINILTSGIEYTKGGAVISTDTLLAEMDQADNLASGDVVTIKGTRRDGSAVSETFAVTVGPTTNLLSSVLAYTASGAPATSSTLLSALDQTAGLTAGDTIAVTGANNDGSSINATYTYAAGDTVGTLLTAISGMCTGATASISDGQILLADDAAGQSQSALNLAYSGSGTFDLPVDFTKITTGGDGSTAGDLLTAITLAFADPADKTQQWSAASLVNGAIRLSDTASGYSQTDIELACSDATALDFPNYFQILSAGGNATKNTNFKIFDSQGIGHVLSATFVRTDTKNRWDMVLKSVEGDVDLLDRRINGIVFMADGSYGGPDGAVPDSSTFQMTFGYDPTNVRTINVNLGTIGEFDGLSQFGGESTVAPNNQDGYASGWLSSLSISSDGVLSGIFTNGVRRDVAAIQMASFQNPAGLQGLGNNYFESTANSGTAVTTKALAGNTGSIRGGSLEKSNVNVAVEFVNLMQAQNGFQANARTIKVANDMLRELTNLMR